MAAEYLQRMGARIKEQRDAKGLSQTALARLLPGTIDGNQVSRWELGKHRPSDDTLEALARALDVDVAVFLAAAPEKERTPDPFAGQSQLDRIEAKLDRILSRLGADDAESRLDELVRLDEADPLPQQPSDATEHPGGQGTGTGTP